MESQFKEMFMGRILSSKGAKTQSLGLLSIVIVGDTLDALFDEWGIEIDEKTERLF